MWGGPPLSYARLLFEALVTRSDAPGALNKGDIPVRAFFFFPPMLMLLSLCRASVGAGWWTTTGRHDRVRR